MPSYNANISLNSDTVFPGAEIEGTASFTPSKVCTLKAAKLEVVCQACYHHQGRKRYWHEQPNIVIPLMHRDGMRAVQREERLTRVHRPTIFSFRAQLPPDLLPSTSGRCRDVLDVSYTLRLSTRRGFLGRRREDAAVAFHVVALLNLCSQPFSEMAHEEVVVQNMQFGQGIDLIASARVPRLGWESLQTVPVKLDVSRVSQTDSYRLVLYLERTISYRERTTITDIAQSRPVRIPSETSPYELTMTIPDDTPVTGVMYCPILSVHYRLRVEIKSTVNRVPTFVLALPLVIGTRKQLLTAGLSWEEGGFKPDLLRGPGHGGAQRRAPSVSEACSSHEPQSARSSASVFSSTSRLGSRPPPSVENSQPPSSMDVPTMPSSMEASSNRQSANLESGRRHPRYGEGHTTVAPEERPTLASSRPPSGWPTPCPAPATEPARAAEDSGPTPGPPRDRQTTAASADTGCPPAGHQPFASVDTKPSFQWPSLASEGPLSTSATSQARLHVANPSFATSYTETASREVLLSLGSSGPQAMGRAGYAHVSASRLRSAHQAARKKQAEPPVSRQTSGDWQNSPRCYESQASQVFPLRGAFPPQSQYGALASDTLVKGVVGPATAPQADTAEYSLPSHESNSSDKAPLCPRAGGAAKRAKKRDRDSA